MRRLVSLRRNIGIWRCRDQLLFIGQLYLERLERCTIESAGFPKSVVLLKAPDTRPSLFVILAIGVAVVQLFLFEDLLNLRDLVLVRPKDRRPFWGPGCRVR